MDTDFKLHNGGGGLCCKSCGRQDKQLNTYDWLADVPGNDRESDLVEKDATLLYPQEQPIADQHNMAFMSTVVAAGHGHGIVVRCAKDSEVGKIAALLKE